MDISGQLGDVLALPEHLRDALWRVESAIMQDWDTSAGLVVAGMGGSAIGGALARAALGDHATRPIFVTRAYGLPPWTTPDTMVLCASYSGDTEETLACYESAGALGARRIVATTGGRLAEMARADGVPVIPLPGGFQPRAAVAYMTVAALEVAALCGAGPRLTSEIDVAASHSEQLVEDREAAHLGALGDRDPALEHGRRDHAALASRAGVDRQLVVPRRSRDGRLHVALDDVEGALQVALGGADVQPVALRGEAVQARADQRRQDLALDRDVALGRDQLEHSRSST